MIPEAVPVANPVVVLREELDDWAVLFNPDTAEAVGVNPVGVLVWKLMDGSRSLDEIVAEVRQQFSDVPAAIEFEIEQFINDLVDRGMVGRELTEHEP